jgi:hypothetical protein
METTSVHQASTRCMAAAPLGIRKHGGLTREMDRRRIARSFLLMPAGTQRRFQNHRPKI